MPTLFGTGWLACTAGSPMNWQATAYSSQGTFSKGAATLTGVQAQFDDLSGGMTSAFSQDPTTLTIK